MLRQEGPIYMLRQEGPIYMISIADIAEEFKVLNKTTTDIDKQITEHNEVMNRIRND